MRTVSAVLQGLSPLHHITTQPVLHVSPSETITTKLTGVFFFWQATRLVSRVGFDNTAIWCKAQLNLYNREAGFLAHVFWSGQVAACQIQDSSRHLDYNLRMNLKTNWRKNC